MATRSYMCQTVERQISDQAKTNDEAVVTQVYDQMQVTRVSDQTQTQNSTKPLIMREDIASLAQEIPQ